MTEPSIFYLSATPMDCLRRHKCNFESSHWPLFGILVVTVIAFWPTFTNGFQMEWDDQWQVMNAFTSDGLRMYALRISFTEGISGQYDPINQLLYTLLFFVGGYNPALFHIASLLLHMANICCVYALLTSMLKDCSTIDTERCKWIVVITTLFFAIHPLQVETVAWVSASKILLSTLFYLLATIMLIRFLKSGRIKDYAFILLYFLLSYLSKEAAITFPLWASILCFWYKVTIRDNRFWKVLLPLYGIALLMVLHTIFIVTQYDKFIQGNTYVWWQRFVLFFYSITTYIFKWLVPLRLSWMYSFPAPVDKPLPAWLIPYPLLFCLLVYAIRDWLKRKHVASALTFSLIHLLLVLHIIALPRGGVIADRYMYLPILGLNFILAYTLTDSKRFVCNSIIIISFISLLAVGCITLSYHRTKKWNDSSTLKNKKSIRTNYIQIQ